MQAEKQYKAATPRKTEAKKSSVQSEFADNRPKAAAESDLIRLIGRTHPGPGPEVFPERMPAPGFSLSPLQAKSGGKVLQGVFRIGGDPVQSLQDLNDIFGPDSIKEAICKEEGLGEVSDQEIDYSLRSMQLDLPSSRKDFDKNKQILIGQLIGEIRQNRDILSAANSVLTERFADYPAVGNAILENSGPKEFLRLQGLTALLWESGQISVEKIIEILQNPFLTNDYLNDFMGVLSAIRTNPLSLKILGHLPVKEIEASLKEGELEGRLSRQADLFTDLASSEKIDAMNIMEIEEQERFDEGTDDSMRDRRAALQADLSIVREDVDFNLSEDLTYIRRLEETLNRMAPLPDGKDSDYHRLKQELDRMKGIYAYKINYIAIARSMQERRKKKMDVLSAEISALEIKCQAVQDPVFRPRATRGYRMRKMRDAQNKRNDYQRQIEEKKAKIKEITQQRVGDLDKDFAKKATDFLRIGKEYLDIMETGAMLLPADMRLAGIFPRSKAIRIDRNNKRHRNLLLYRHARDLIMHHGLFKQPAGTQGKGFLSGARAGCVCIMYVKEGKIGDPEGATYRPFFGASGVDPYEKSSKKTEAEIENLSYTRMGLPSPVGNDSDCQQAVATLQNHIQRMKELGIKPPSLQSQLYFLQVPEYHSNQSKRIAGEEPVDLLESWMPSNCAEPAIMTAIYQLYHTPTDIYLSVPFEGELYRGKLLLKYTCARCAVSEPAFMSPHSTHDTPRYTDMRLRRRGGIPVDKLNASDLIYNASHQEHPYKSKMTAIREAFKKSQAAEIVHAK